MTRILYFFRILLLFISVFLIYRFIFFLLYFKEHQIQADQIYNILRAFGIGLRFDLSTSMIILSAPMIFLWLPIDSKYLVKIRNFLVGNFISYILIVILILLLSDIIYYKFATKPIGFEIFIFFHYVSEIFTFIIKSFWMHLAAFLVVAFFTLRLWKIFFSIERIFMDAHSKTTLWIFLCIHIIFSIVCIRGGLQSRPLRISMAFQDDNIFLGHLALNGVYTIIRSLYQKDSYPLIERRDRHKNGIRSLLASPKESFLSQEYPFFRKGSTPKFSETFQKLNVVLIVMESWGFSDIGYSGHPRKATPFFDNLISKGVFFNSHYSAGQRTIPVMGSIVSSIPPLFGNVFSSSAYQHHNQRSLASILKKKGYKTIFLYASKNNSMGFSSYARMTGFERIITKEDFDTSKVEEDGSWGVYDEYAFDRLHKEIKTSKKPFFAMLITLHPHLPHKIPSDKRKYFPEEIDFYSDMRYTDDCLKNFLKLLYQEPFFKDTLFIITADHAFDGKKGIELFHTPLLFYKPNLLSHRIEQAPASHLDIAPSILDILKINSSHAFMGKSLFSKTPRWAIVDMDNFTGWLQNDLILLNSRMKKSGLYYFRSDPHLKKNLIRKKELNLSMKKLYQNWERFASNAAYSIVNDKLVPAILPIKNQELGTRD